MNPLFNSSVITILEKALDSSAMRHKVISNNLANVNTPGFKRSEVHFEEELAKVLDKNTLALKGTDSRHIGVSSLNSLNPKVVQDNSTTMRTDGNNVDIDREMAQLAMNQILYSAVVQRLNGKFNSLRHVISEGRK